MKIAIIPARGSSKRIPRKNVKIFCGKPMIGWAIEKAIRSNLFDEVIVSTDDQEIAELSISYGASVPFSRPSNLADDFTPTLPVVRHALTAYEALKGCLVDYACCIYPCTPLLMEEDLKAAFEIVIQSGVNFVYPVTEYSHPIQRALRVSNDLKISFRESTHELTRTQDLEKFFHDVGQFYWGTGDAWRRIDLMHSNSHAYIIPYHRVVDIDTNDDWKRAEDLYKAINYKA